MNAALRRPLLYLCLLLPILTVACARTPAPLPPPPPPAVIARVTAAKKIFLSNAGADSYFVSDIPGGANVSYNELYSSLKQWGYFQLVDSATQADLIFEIRSTESCDWEHTGNITANHYNQACSAPFLNLSILDPSTRASLYTIVLPAGRGSTIPKGKIAFTQSIEVLTNKIKALVVSPAPTQKQ